MTIENWWLYVATVLVFMSTPGPSHLLMISVGMTNGFQRSLATAAGDLSANVIQMALAGFGLATVLLASEFGFATVKWCGVAYLAWMGIRQILASFKHKGAVNEAPVVRLRTLWTKGFVTSAANPKAVVFFAALFPQFINHNVPIISQIVILGVTYLFIDGMFLAFYGKSAHWLADRVSRSGQALLDRAAGAGLIGTAILLGMKTNKDLQSQ